MKNIQSKTPLIHQNIEHHLNWCFDLQLNEGKIKNWPSLAQWLHDNDIFLEAWSIRYTQHNVVLFGIFKNTELYNVTYTNYQDPLYLTLALNTNLLDKSYHKHTFSWKQTLKIGIVVAVCNSNMEKLWYFSNQAFQFSRQIHQVILQDLNQVTEIQKVSWVTYEWMILISMTMAKSSFSVTHHHLAFLR